MNEQAEGKHHIGDFLPPEELKKFMEKYDSKLNNREPDISDYKEYKLKEDNIGKNVDYYFRDDEIFHLKFRFSNATKTRLEAGRRSTTRQHRGSS